MDLQYDLHYDLQYKVQYDLQYDLEFTAQRYKYFATSFHRGQRKVDLQIHIITGSPLGVNKS